MTFTPRAYSVKMVADLLGLNSTDKVYKMIHQKDNPLEAIKLPGVSLRVLPEALERYLECHALQSRPDCSSEATDIGMSDSRVVNIRQAVNTVRAQSSG